MTKYKEDQPPRILYFFARLWYFFREEESSDRKKNFNFQRKHNWRLGELSPFSTIPNSIFFKFKKIDESDNNARSPIQKAAPDRCCTKATNAPVWVYSSVCLSMYVTPSERLGYITAIPFFSSPYCDIGTIVERFFIMVRGILRYSSANNGINTHKLKKFQGYPLHRTS